MKSTLADTYSYRSPAAKDRNPSKTGAVPHCPLGVRRGVGPAGKSTPPPCLSGTAATPKPAVAQGASAREVGLTSTEDSWVGDG